ncbi:MAG: GIY-YIG nuclease family protein [Candidatus Aminicenantaceae bacterium]
MAEELCLRKENNGSYVLVLHVQQPCWVKAGKLPEREFLPGIYLYIGRAKKHLRGRLTRHLRTEKKLFWHVDYLLRKVQIKEIWCRLDFFNECQIASEIIGACGEYCSLILGFGASDCQCPSHLIYYYGEDSFLSPLRNKINLRKVRIDEDHI